MAVAYVRLEDVMAIAGVESTPKVMFLNLLACAAKSKTNRKVPCSWTQAKRTVLHATEQIAQMSSIMDPSKNATHAPIYVTCDRGTVRRGCEIDAEDESLSISITQPTVN